MNKENYHNAIEYFGVDAINECEVRVLDIPDQYEHMHPQLIKAFEEQYEPV